jgi:ribosomal protein S6E (S10)
MKKFLMLAVSILAVATLASVSVAADAPAAAPGKQAKKVAAAPKTTMGEVTAVTPGKSVSVKDEKGKTHKFTISKKTKIEGDLKMGAKVDVTSKGSSAEEIKVSGGAEAPAAPMAPAAPAPSAPKM